MSPLAPRCDWAVGREAPGTSALSAPQRNRLCEEWTRVALMEHASIAAFAQFTLQLLAVGAPPDLVEASQQAAIDETEHARLAFALATGYGGCPIGPGPLDVLGVLGDAAESTSVIESAIAGGCVNETIAAIEAAEALQGATDSAVRAALTRIACDEAQHATLAWRFVKWALESADTRLRHAARTGLLSLLERAEVPLLPGDATIDANPTPGASVETGDALLAHGHLSDSMRQEIAKRALLEVVRPCAAALLAVTTKAYPVAA